MYGVGLFPTLLYPPKSKCRILESSITFLIYYKQTNQKQAVSIACD